ncbi:MarR family winged helix-turn-helix transcriptional regulator [Nocardia sp. NPDC051990]|uniref:MarR family winged helix-turn-helix transcriptional regulator n=1 Tax=Nocardia sp. NPDC051990 TaxID=3155285 RepID=UPI003420A05F
MAFEQASGSPGPQRSGGPQVAFLLAQLGSHAAQRFSERIAALELTPPDVGVLRMIAMDPGGSQRALAEKLGVVPSRVVALIDHLANKGLVERRRSTTDRRNHELHPTAAARELMISLWPVVQAHEADITSALTPEERDQLAALLVRIAEQQGLDNDVHPGYRRS